MKCKFKKIMMMSSLLASIACSHTPKNQIAQNSESFDIPQKVELILAKTENLGQYRMTEVKFNRR